VTADRVLSMLMYVSMYPTSRSRWNRARSFSRHAGALMKAFNMESLSFDTLEKFLNIEMYSLFWMS